MPALLQMRGITKSFPGVRALNGIDLDLDKGEVLALLGENGAGKSTLIKVLGGAHVPDAGTIMIEGRSVSITNPHDSQARGHRHHLSRVQSGPRADGSREHFSGPGRRHASLDTTLAANISERSNSSSDSACRSIPRRSAAR